MPNWCNFGNVWVQLMSNNWRDQANELFLSPSIFVVTCIDILCITLKSPTPLVQQITPDVHQQFISSSISSKIVYSNPVGLCGVFVLFWNVSSSSFWFSFTWCVLSFSWASLLIQSRRKIQNSLCVSLAFSMRWPFTWFVFRCHSCEQWLWQDWFHQRWK
jgi:hypothetical protein